MAWDGTLICLPHHSFNCVDEGTLPWTGGAKHTDPELGYIINFQSLETIQFNLVTKLVHLQLIPKSAKFGLQIPPFPFVLFPYLFFFLSFLLSLSPEFLSAPLFLLSLFFFYKFSLFFFALLSFILQPFCLCLLCSSPFFDRVICISVASLLARTILKEKCIFKCKYAGCWSGC